MKKSCAIGFITLSFLIFGCKKDKTPDNNATKSLVGHWFSMFNYQWYGEVVLNADGTGEIIHYPPYTSDTSKTQIEWTASDTSLCWSYLGSPDKCLSYYKIMFYSKDSIVIYQNINNGWYAQFTKRNNYASYISPPSCIAAYYYDSSRYDISRAIFDPSMIFRLNNNRQVSITHFYGYSSLSELYDGNFNLINHLAYIANFISDTTYNVNSINNSGAYTGQFFPNVNYSKRGGYYVLGNQRTIITIPNSDYCSAELINDNNIIVGKVQYMNNEKIYFYNNSSIDTFSMPFQYDYLNLIDINKVFVLASYGNFSDNTDHYIKIFFNKSIQSLNFTKDFHFIATNNLGQIAGTYYSQETHCDTYPFVQYNVTFGFVLEPDNSCKLYSEPRSSNVTFLDINDNGDILGSGNGHFLLKKH